MHKFFLNIPYDIQCKFTKTADELSFSIYSDPDFYLDNHTFVFSSIEPIIIKNNYYTPQPPQYKQNRIITNDLLTFGAIKTHLFNFVPTIVPFIANKETYSFNGKEEEALVLHFSPETIFSELENWYNNCTPTPYSEYSSYSNKLVIEIPSHYFKKLFQLYQDFNHIPLPSYAHKDFPQYLFDKGIIDDKQKELAQKNTYLVHMLKGLFLTYYEDSLYCNKPYRFFPIKLVGELSYKLDILHLSNDEEQPQYSINFFNKFFLKHFYLYYLKNDFANFSDFYYLMDFPIKNTNSSNHFVKIFTDVLTEQNVPQKEIEQYLIKYFTKTPQVDIYEINQKRLVSYFLEFKKYNPKKFFSHIKKFFTQKSSGNLLFNELFDAIFSQEEKELYKDIYQPLFPSFYQTDFSFSQFFEEKPISIKKVHFDIYSLYKSIPQAIDYGSFLHIFRHTLETFYSMEKIRISFLDTFIFKNNKPHLISDITILISTDESNSNSIYGTPEFCQFFIKEVYKNLNTFNECLEQVGSNKKHDLHKLLREINLSYQIKNTEKLPLSTKKHKI